MKIVGVVGARPNFMKIDPIWRVLRREPERFTPRLVHTGQHYDERMSRVFFRDLELQPPDVDLGVGSGSHAEQTGTVMIRVEKVLNEEKPDLVMVVGDVNSTVAATLTAVKLGIPVAHVEAGLRSYDRTMPEEINRVVTDALSTYLFTPSRDADENLRREGVAEDRIFFVGNVMIDTLRRCLARAEGSQALERLGVRKKEYALLTLHRPSNVDDPDRLGAILDAVTEIQERVPVIFPVHPRTEKQIREFGFGPKVERAANLRLIPPLGYLDFLALQRHARLVLTDSGGVQEETTVLGVPCLTLRENTERPVTLAGGNNLIVGSHKEQILAGAWGVLDGAPRPGRVPELWDGRAAERIVAVLRGKPPSPRSTGARGFPDRLLKSARPKVTYAE